MTEDLRKHAKTIKQLLEEQEVVGVEGKLTAPVYTVKVEQTLFVPLSVAEAEIEKAKKRESILATAIRVDKTGDAELADKLEKCQNNACYCLIEGGALCDWHSELGMVLQAHQNCNCDACSNDKVVKEVVRVLRSGSK